MKTKILVTGGGWMLGSDFLKYQQNNFDITALSKRGLDITSLESIKKILVEVQPDVVLNCAAYTTVDDAERKGKKMNYEVNALGVANLALACREQSIDLITLSTDYVFDGEKQDGYNETDIPNPLSAYGIAKYLGERLAQNIYPASIIVRTSWLYGGSKWNKNFVNTILQLSETWKEIKVVNDQYGIPNSSYDVCLALWVLIDTIEKHRGQILHFSSTSTSTVPSRFDLARYILQCAKKTQTILPCSSQEFGAKARRPRCSILCNNSDIHLLDWEEGLLRYIREYYI
jgi:dTDP-4-dehydrorhamnose reductase